jgi:Tol biopolymer transport system component
MTATLARPRLMIGVAAALSIVGLAGCSGHGENRGGHTGAERSTGSRGDSTLVFRRVRVWRDMDFSFYGATPSPDGRQLAFVDWRRGALTLLDLETGNRRVVIGSASAEDTANAVDGCRFSPDGRKLAYTSWSMSSGGWGVDIIDLDGGLQRILVPQADTNQYISLQDWSAAGQLLMWVRALDEMVTLVLVSATDGTARALDRFGIVPPERAVLSPDGQFVAFDHAADPSRPEYDIHVAAVYGNGREDLVGDDSDDRLLGWMPDGSGILSYSDRASTPGLWYLPVEAGAPSGAPRLLRGDIWNVFPLGFSGDRYYYGVEIDAAPQLYVGTVDLDAGRVLSEPVPVAGPSQARTNKGIWSPDGSRLAYVWQRYHDPWWAWRLAVRDLRSGETHTLALPFDLDRLHRMEWLPDGRSLAVWGQYALQLGLFQFDLVSGAVTPLVTGRAPPFMDMFHGALSLDGTTLYHRRPGDPRGGVPWRIVARDLASGAEREVVRTTTIAARTAVSPDGSMLSFVEVDSLEHRYRVSVVPVSGGTPREVYRGPLFTPQPINLWWTWDGSSILFGGEDVERGQTLLRIPVIGGDTQVIRGLPNVLNFRLHPDGHRYLSLSHARVGELWVIENLLAARDG